MSKLDDKAAKAAQAAKPAEADPTPTEATQAPQVEPSTKNVPLITEQQVMFGSAPALTPARRPNVAHRMASAVHAMFVRPERRHPPKHYPQRLAYLEYSAMSREMDRL
ncbi:hypothetical protein CQY20_19735 [Mycolicibacterium agri]|uniref:Uncharacterized protein n=1 Tax=Mycolicibacterium agri TaxID=36811 RepID=A0A2A7MWS9_MYCAG|nr:hypothetical protein [Mycolicibacterium agri]PEG36134.1 hypothetical protein CQY20_19735 [Mycolicibacterium agri]GFG54940.1 hypothetical protein MAGR_63810 [Mycolicibacterium agri]